MKVLWFVLIFQTAATAQTTPSIAEAARQERERRQNLPPGRLITDQTIRDLTAPPISDLVAKSPDKGEVKPDQKDQKAVEKPKTETHDEAWWRETFKNAREDLKKAEDHVKVTQLELNKLNMEFLTRSDIYDREQQLGPPLNAKRSELTIAQSEVDRAKEKLAQLEDDLRRSGGLPGWAR